MFTKLEPSGPCDCELSVKNVANKESASENLWSTRVVRRFSVVLLCEAKLKIPKSPVSAPLGRGKMLRNGTMLELIGTVPAVSRPARAFRDGTVSGVVVPR